MSDTNQPRCDAAKFLSKALPVDFGCDRCYEKIGKVLYSQSVGKVILKPVGTRGIEIETGRVECPCCGRKRPFKSEWYPLEQLKRNFIQAQKNPH